MMQRVWMVAARDFSVTVSNKGFLLGILLMPILICIFVFLGPRILHGRSPVVAGQVAVMDATGTLMSDIGWTWGRWLSPLDERGTRDPETLCKKTIRRFRVFRWLRNLGPRTFRSQKTGWFSRPMHPSGIWR